MNYPSTHPALWHRTVAWILLLLLPVYAFGSSSLAVEPKAEAADNVIKAPSIHINTYEANRALTSRTGPDASTEARPLLLSPGLPAEGFLLSQTIGTAQVDPTNNPHKLWRGLKTPLQLFFCVLQI